MASSGDMDAMVTTVRVGILEGNWRSVIYAPLQPLLHSGGMKRCGHNGACVFPQHFEGGFVLRFPLVEPILGYVREKACDPIYSSTLVGV